MLPVWDLRAEGLRGGVLRDEVQACRDEVRDEVPRVWEHPDGVPVWEHQVWEPVCPDEERACRAEVQDEVPRVWAHPDEVPVSRDGEHPGGELPDEASLAWGRACGQVPEEARLPLRGAVRTPSCRW